MSAEDYFKLVRSEVAALARDEEMLERLRAREGVKAQGYGPSGSGAGSDPMDVTVRRMEFEQRIERRIAESARMVDEACAVLYGTSGRGGLAKSKGTRYADAICMAYVQAESWADIADVMQCSAKWARSLCRVGFEHIDAVGMEVLENS